MAKPITPSEARDRFNNQIPDQIIEVFNKLIVENLDINGHSKFSQTEVVDTIMYRFPLPSKQTIFDNHWLDVEDLYRKQGWIVEFDKPAWNEGGESYFSFRMKGQ